MSEAQVKNDVVAEAPSAEELKNLKRAAEDDEVDSKKQKTNGANHEDAEDEENGEGERRRKIWKEKVKMWRKMKRKEKAKDFFGLLDISIRIQMRKAKTKKGKEMKMRANK